MSGQRRLHIGKSHEQAVAEKLRRHGWLVHPWGQGLFADDERGLSACGSGHTRCGECVGVGERVREALVCHEPKTMWRWIPDLIAIKAGRVCLVDPKTDQRGDTPNFSLEVDAYMTHMAMRSFGLPIVYVWQDFTCNAPQLLEPVRWVLEPQRGKVAGSGTPFILIRKADQYPFDSYFGPEWQEATA